MVPPCGCQFSRNIFPDDELTDTTAFDATGYIKEMSQRGSRKQDWRKRARLTTLRKAYPTVLYVRQILLHAPRSFSAHWELCFVRFLEEPAAPIRVLTTSVLRFRAADSGHFEQPSCIRGRRGYLLNQALLLHGAWVHR